MPFLTRGALLTGFIKRTTTHCYIQNMKALGHVVSEKIFFYVLPHHAPGAGPVWTPGARLAGFINGTIIHCYTQNMKALGLMDSEKKAGFIKRTTTHCYIQNMKALGHVVSEKIFFMFCPITPPGRGLYGPQGHGWQDF